MLEGTWVIAIKAGPQTNTGRGFYGIKLFWEGACVCLTVFLLRGGEVLIWEGNKEQVTGLQIFVYKKNFWGRQAKGRRIEGFGNS